MQQESKGGAVCIELTSRQLEIIDIVKKHLPVTGDQIAEMLGVSKPTIRSDLAVLVMLGYIDAKPKVGYFLGKAFEQGSVSVQRLKEYKVKDIQGVPVVVQASSTVHDAVITLFLENVGTLIVVDADGCLEGLVSRKDLLKVTLGNAASTTMPLHLVMTRQPNIITISPEDSVIEAARKMIHHEIDSLPVIKLTSEEAGAGAPKQLVVGRITKTHMTRLLLELATEA